MTSVDDRVRHLQEICLLKGLTAATAESCTGGLLSATLVNQPGSSGYFLGGVVSYSNKAKQVVLGVHVSSLESFGAVSAEVAAEMADSARKLLGSDAAISITGIAGPEGGTVEKPIGLTFIGLADRREIKTYQYCWDGDRSANRWSSVEQAVTLLIEWVERQ